MHILLVDDHALYRAGLKELITSLILNVSITDVGNGEEAMSIIQDKAFDVLILDLAMPKMNGFELIADLKKRRLKNFKILAVTNYTETAVVYHLLQQGVDGFLSKNVNEDVLVEAIQTVLKGEIYYSEEYSEKIKYFISTGNNPKFKLSKNEIEIIKLLSSGKSSKEIAHLLNYSVRSVETKRYRLERKMFAKNSTELVSIAIKCGLI